MRISTGLLLCVVVALPAALAAPAQAGQVRVEPGKVAAVRKKLKGILKRLGDDSWRVREKASEELVTLGPPAVTLIAEHVNHRDPEVAMRVQQALLRLKGRPGAAIEGLTLSAALVGRKPRPGEAVTLWLTITNTSKADISIFQHFWSLALQPEPDKGTSHARTVFVSMKAEVKPLDFLRLKPGQSICCLMDAEPIKSAKGAALTQAYLEIAAPGKARKAVKGKLFSGSRELVSGPIEMAYAADAEGADAKADALLASFLKGEAGAEGQLDPRQKNAAAARLARKALRLGLRQAKEDERWKVFHFICGRPHPELEDDVVDFLGRLGPRSKPERKMHKGLEAFARALPEKRRPAFAYRAAVAMIQDWRMASNLASSFTNSSRPVERAAAARVFLKLYERGDRRAEVLNWLAVELFTTKDPKLRDPKKAALAAEEAVKAAPGRADFKFNLACIRGKKEDLDALAARVKSPQARNSMAWNLVTKFPVDPARSRLALRLSKQAVQATDAAQSGYPYRLDTLAVCHAACGNYAEALKLEEKAFREMPAGEIGERTEYGARIARFTALVKAGEDERPARVLDSPPLKSKAARDALLARLKTEKEALILRETKRLLKTCFGKSPEVLKALK